MAAAKKPLTTTAANEASTAASLREIEAEAGEYAATARNPTGLVASYEDSHGLPWVLVDDHTVERYATLPEAKQAAREWAAAMRGA